MDDEQIPLASTVLSELGLPLGTPDPFLVKAGGITYTKASLHRLTLSEDPGPVRYLALFPSSYIPFTPIELEAPQPEVDDKLRIPRPSATYAALIRLLASMPSQSRARCALLAELSQLILYHLFRADLSDSYDEDEDENDYNVETDPTVIQAMSMVRAWEFEWRDGEEWIGDVLASLVQGRCTFSLPWTQPKSPTSCGGAYLLSKGKEDASCATLLSTV